MIGKITLYYASGFVVRNIIKYVDCNLCKEALFHKDGESLPLTASLTIPKQKGGLQFSSKGVFLVVQATEKAFLWLTSRHFELYSYS